LEGGTTEQTLRWSAASHKVENGGGTMIHCTKVRWHSAVMAGWCLAAGIFPLVELPTGNQDRGLGAGHVRVFLPLWVQKSFGEWTTYGGGGYWINQDEHLGDKNYWFFGWLLQRKITEHLTLGGEIFHQTADTIDGVDSTGFNFGGIYDFDEHNHLLFSAGRGFRHAPETNLFSWYLAWQITY
jgi:hypothetical protein